MNTASSDGPYGLLAACPIFNIGMSYCDVDYCATKTLACLLACLLNGEMSVEGTSSKRLV